MAATPDLLTTVLGLLSGLGELRQRKMFGGTYIYCDDLFIATVHDGALYFKVNANTAPESSNADRALSRTPSKGESLRFSTIKHRPKFSTIAPL